jgi:gluconate 5-dehydrogenase
MNDELFSVAGQVVLVSGASRGIGRAIAEGFARRGAQVVITGRERDTVTRAARDIDPSGKTVYGMVCDVADTAAIGKLVKDVLAQFGRVDTLINVAGVNRRMLAERLSEADWDFIVDINLKGPFLLSQAVGKAMLERGRGNQINIVSLNNDRPLKGVMPYAASKAALGHMTRSLALEWGPRGVRVNAIAPGFVLTDLTKKLWAQPKMQEWGRANTPLVRIGEPKDMIGAALFLASEASAWMTGQILYVDGGFSAGLCWPIDFDNPCNQDGSKTKAAEKRRTPNSLSALLADQEARKHVDQDLVENRLDLGAELRLAMAIKPRHGHNPRQYTHGQHDVEKHAVEVAELFTPADHQGKQNKQQVIRANANVIARLNRLARVNEKVFDKKPVVKHEQGSPAEQADVGNFSLANSRIAQHHDADAEREVLQIGEARDGAEQTLDQATAAKE